MNFKKLNTKLYQKSGPVITPDYIYWKQLGVPVLVKEFGAIDYIDFSPIEPHYFAVTCSVRVQVYNPITKLVVKNLSRFRENAYGAVFRNDGKLLCAGGEESVVKLFDVASKSLLRMFKGHTGPVHRTLFLADQPQIASFSDDKSVKIWDIATEKDILTFNEHTDYIRAAATSPVVSDIVLSGGYDNQVKMYDIRTNQSILTVNHGAPIESLLFLPSGGIILSAGGTDIKVWDTFAGGKLLGSISQHHKTITCLRLASNNKRLLSGSLDRHVKIYDVATFKVVHTLDYPNAVLSLGVSKNDDTVVAGLVDGLVSISRREVDKTAENVEKKVVNYKYSSNTHAKLDAVVTEETKESQSKHDNALRKFQYNYALDLVLRGYITNKTPEITVSVMQELIRRKALARALMDRDTKFYTLVLRFLIRNIPDYRFTRVLINVANTLLDVCDLENVPADVLILFKNLSLLLKDECELGETLAALQGSVDLVLAASTAAEDVASVNDMQSLNLMPSEEAQKNLVVNLT